ncbi:MAG TPA: hypothetical protein VKZ18_12090 [Polyangia bacterium]|nr:hypothetical protein [Polyangia bacterium]
MTTQFHGPASVDDFLSEAAWFDPELDIPYEGQTRMRLHFAKGVSDLSLRVAANQTALIGGHFYGPLPDVSVAGEEVSIQYRRFGIADWLGGVLRGERVGATLVLHPAVAWDLVFHGGASQVEVDLRQGRVTGVEISGGASDVRLALPAPDAIVPLRIRGGASDLTVTRPANIPVGVRVRGGVSHLEIDRRQIGAAGGPLALDSDGWSSAAARYDLQLTGGASRLSVAA